MKKIFKSKYFCIIVWAISGITTMATYEQVPMFIYFCTWFALMFFMIMTRA